MQCTVSPCGGDASDDHSGGDGDDDGGSINDDEDDGNEVDLVCIWCAVHSLSLWW